MLLGGLSDGCDVAAAALATDPMPYPDIDPNHIAEHVIPSFLKVWPVWLLWAGLSLLGLVAGHLWLASSVGDAAATARKWSWITRGLFLLIAVFWITLFVH